MTTPDTNINAAVLDNLTIRSAEMDDAAAVAKLINHCTVLEEGIPTQRPEDVRRHWQSPDFDLDSDTFLAFTPEGKLVGYGRASSTEPHVVVWSGVRVHPDYRGHGIADHLLELTEERAEQALKQAPSGAQVTLRREVHQSNDARRDLLIQNGYESTRYFWRMAIDLDKPVPQAKFPEGVLVRSANLPEDLPAIAKAVDVIFEDHYGHVAMPEEKVLEHWQHWIDTDKSIDPALWFLAVIDTPDGEEIVGASICLPRLPEDRDMAHIDVLGIKREWRRKGMAIALLHHSFNAFRQHNKPYASLFVDAASLTGATRLYEKAGMYVDREYEEFTKVLRTGEDLTTQSLN